MITAIGLLSDATLTHFVETASAFGFDVRCIDLSDVVRHGEWHLSLPPHSGDSWVTARSTTLKLDAAAPYYCRVINLAGVDIERRTRWHSLTEGLATWLELASGVVVNRPGHVHDNATKPLHEAMLERMGFSVPASLTSSRHADLVAFSRLGRTVAKAVSGQRVDCRPVTPEDFHGYEDGSGPVHLQRYITGYDVRVHVVGDLCFALRIESNGIDYRIDPEATFTPIDVPSDLARQLVTASSSMGLTFSGWDFRLDQDTWWALEVNPMPGYSYYDARLDGKITYALAAHLARVAPHSLAQLRTRVSQARSSWPQT